MASKGNKMVAVTGANGFIGSWVVKTLLEKGYTVHASVFPGSHVSHIRSLPGATEDRLVIFEADVRDAEAISKAIKGCEGVFHVASPCDLEDPKDPETELIKPAVEGTMNVLEASKKYGVKRVVITSSILAIFPNPGWDNSAPLDESSWADLDFCKSQKKWYSVSKTLAEKAAWEFAEKNKMDIVTIHPSLVLGPMLQPYVNSSTAMLQLLLQGCKDPLLAEDWLGAVHVRDVANAQVLLFETPSASGRYLCTNGIFQFCDFAQTVSKLYPEFSVHRFEGETQLLMGCKDAAKKLITLGLKFTPVEDTVRESVESLKAGGFL